MTQVLLKICNFLLEVNKNIGTATEQTSPTLDPIYNLLTVLLPTAMGIVFTVGTIYGVVLGVQYSKASGADERAKVKKRLYSAIIGIVVIIALLGFLFAMREPLSQWIA